MKCNNYYTKFIYTYNWYYDYADNSLDQIIIVVLTKINSV